MKSVQIQSLTETVFAFDVVCDCGSNGLKDVKTEQFGFKHTACIGGEDVILVCECGAQHRIHVQLNHFHITTD